MSNFKKGFYQFAKLELIYFVCKSSKKIPSVRLTNISLSLIT